MSRFTAVLFIILFISTGSLFPQILNGNFDSGRTGWQEASTGGYTLIGTGQFFYSTSIDPPVYPRSGDWMARIGGYAYEVNAIGQTIQLPNTTPLYLAFAIQTRSSSASECAGPYVGALVKIIINNQIVFQAYLCDDNDVLNWVVNFIDFSQIAGQQATVIFRAESANSVWSYLYIDDVRLTDNITSVEPGIEPRVYTLEQNYPNPFNPSTSIKFSLPREEHVSLKVFDILGNEVSELINNVLPEGDHTAEFKSAGLASGTYFYILRAGDYTEIKKMQVLK